MVARAVSPTSAATSTKLAAATMSNCTAPAVRRAIEDASACAEPIERDKCRRCRDYSADSIKPEDQP
jgi:hypothetical protein